MAPATSLGISSVPVCGPAEVGVKITSMVHCAPEDTGVLQLFVWRKALEPETETAPTFRTAPPGFDTVRASDLCWPTGRLPKWSADGKRAITAK